MHNKHFPRCAKITIMCRRRWGYPLRPAMIVMTQKNAGKGHFTLMDCSVRWSVLHAKIISSPPNKNVRQMINLICSIWCTAHLQVLRWDPHLRPSFEPSLEFINFMLRPLRQKGHKGAYGHKSMHDLSPNKLTHCSCSFDGSTKHQQQIRDYSISENSRSLIDTSEDPGLREVLILHKYWCCVLVKVPLMMARITYFILVGTG